MFRRRKPDVAFAAAVYRRTAERARAPELFERFGIPDTLDGRFDSLSLHAWLMIDRLRLESDGEELAQAFFDAMFRHLDQTLRQIGVQDLGVGRRIKIMAEGLHGRALAYRQAMAGPEGGAEAALTLAEALRRNAYGGSPPAEDEAVALLEAYVRQQAVQLSQIPRRDLAVR